jgi:hypothetical protein
MVGMTGRFERDDLLQESFLAYHHLMWFIREDLLRPHGHTLTEDEEHVLRDRLREYRDTCGAVTIYDHEAKRDKVTVAAEAEEARS